MHIYWIKYNILRLYFRIILFLFISSLTACTTSDKQKTIALEQIKTRLAIKTFSKGLRQISERYIKEVAIEQLAIKGLIGLSSIDPTIRVFRNNDTVSIESNFVKKHIYKNPDKHNASTWAKLIVDLITNSKKESDIFKLTKMGRIYEAVFDGSLSNLDHFSHYANEEKAKKNREKRSGFGGIGISFNTIQEGILVTKVFNKTSAYKKGIKSDDIITKIENSSLTNLKYEDALTYLRGEIGTIVNMDILRPSQKSRKRKEFISHNFSIKRERIIEPTTLYSLLDDILYIQITSFNDQTAQNLTEDIRNGFKDIYRNSGKRAKGIIIDLRGNPGGLLQQAVRVSNLFLINGTIVSTKGRHPSSTNNYEADGIDVTKGLPIVVLINGRSASAAEIVAAALQDHARAVVIGSGSYGKGTIQTLIKLPNGGEIAITWSRFQAPSGYYLNTLGVLPSICVTGSENSKATEHINNTLKNAKQIKENRQSWHASVVGDKLGRKELKRICPTTYKKKPIDIEIAKILLRDIVLYQRIKILNQAAASIHN